VAAELGVGDEVLARFEYDAPLTLRPQRAFDRVDDLLRRDLERRDVFVRQEADLDQRR